MDGVADETYSKAIQLPDALFGLEDHQLAETMVDCVGRCDGYHWLIKNVGRPLLNSRVNFTAYCAQDASIQQQVPLQQLQRFHSRMNTFNCRGTLKGVINRVDNVIELSIQHDRLHPTPGDEASQLTSQQLRDSIQQ